MVGRGARISWQPCQEHRKIKKKQMSGKLLTLYIGYSAVLSLLLIYAAFRMARDQFILELEWNYILLIVLVILGVLTGNELLSSFGREKLRWVGSMLLLAVITLGCLWYCRKYEDELAKGIFSIGGQYMEKWRTYFHMPQQTAVEAAKEEALVWGMGFLLGTAWVQTLSALLRKRSLMLLLPAAVLAAEMSVGLTPGWRGLACMCAGAVLCLYLDFHREFQAAPALTMAVLMGLLLPLTGRLMAGPASQVELLHDELLAFQHRMEQEIRDFDWQELVRSDGKVDNHSPAYEHKEVIKVTASAAPTGTLYLRGYYGTDYRRGFWRAGTGNFDWHCLQNGIGSGEAAELLAGLSSEWGMGEKVQYELQYTGLRSSYVYMPYGADLETAGERYRLEGDYTIKKRRGLKSFHFEGWSSYALTQKMDEADGAEDGDAKSFYAWYNEYALNNYLEVPENLTAVTDMVNSMKQNQSCQNLLRMLDSEKAGDRNAARLLLGSLVATRLQEYADYSLSLEELPAGSDPVEYFLKEGKKGYCAHFASAGVLLLRRLGVPARYVSGYVVMQEEFKQKDGSYTASVQDAAAHAWAEIWLDDRGWVPVEMTPGYSETSSLTVERLDPAQNEKETVSPEPSREETMMTSEPSMLPETEEMGWAEEAVAENGKPGGNAQSEQNQQEGWGFAGEGGWAVFGQNGSLRLSYVICGILGILITAGAGYFLIKWLLHRKKSWWEKLRISIEEGSCRKAVWSINRRLYRQLRRKRAGAVFLRSDEEYLKALRLQYPQISEEEWGQYFRVVSQSVYSQEPIVGEDAEMCFRLLERTQPGKR